MPSTDLRELPSRRPSPAPSAGPVADVPTVSHATTARMHDMWIHSASRLADADELEDVSALFASAFTDIERGMLMVSLEGRFLRINDAAAALLDRAADDLVGVRFHELLTPLDALSGELTMGRMLDGELSHHEGTYAVRTTDGTTRRVSARASVYTSTAGVPLCLIAEVMAAVPTGSRSTDPVAPHHELADQDVADHTVADQTVADQTVAASA